MMKSGGKRGDDLLSVKTDRSAPRIVPMTKKLMQQDIFSKSPYAIQVKDVSYTYGKITKSDFVLKNLNVNVLKGQIYALLGPSGCGKTTILKCITGTLLPSTGQITLPTNSTKYKVPGKGVGYMPQELSLFPDLTIQETLWMFGRINGVSSVLLKEKIQKWSKEFGLPPGHRLVGNLSGGQKRRVSLICAFIHDAPLLILDEPTVGIDPILRRTIWNFMLDLTKTRNTTILLTTHYIDEAKDAHIVGLMREGKLLAESSPSAILSQFNETSLERCFYRICVKGDAEAQANKTCDKDDPESQTLLVHHSNLPVIEPNGVNKGSVKQVSTLEPMIYKESFVSNAKFVARKVIPSLITKNFKLLQRNWFLLFLQFVLPGSTVFLFGLCIGGKVFNLPLAVVNDEDPHDLSLEFLRHLRSDSILQHPFQDMKHAVHSVKMGDNRMVLHIPHDFTYCLRNRIMLGIFSNDAIMKCASVYLHADTTNQIISLEMQNMVIKAFERFEMEFISNYSDASPMVATLPLRIDTPIFGNLDMKFSEYITSSILLVCIHFLASALTGINLVLERHSGVLERFEVCGVSKTQVFTAQLLMNMIIVLIQVALMLGTQFSFFDTKMKGSFVLAITLIILQGFCGMVFGFFISAVATDITSGIMAGIGVFLPNLILCGFVWPLEGMPKPLMWFARFVPVTQTNEALRSVISRGWGLEHFQVQMGLFSVLFWSAFFLIIALVVFRYQK